MAVVEEVKFQRKKKGKSFLQKAKKFGKQGQRGRGSQIAQVTRLSGIAGIMGMNNKHGWQKYILSGPV